MFSTFLVNAYPVTSLVISYGSSQLLIPSGQLINNYLDAASPQIRTRSAITLTHHQATITGRHTRASPAGTGHAASAQASATALAQKLAPTGCQVYMAGPIILTHMRRAFIASKTTPYWQKCRLQLWSAPSRSRLPPVSMRLAMPSTTMSLCGMRRGWDLPNGRRCRGPRRLLAQCGH